MNNYALVNFKIGITNDEMIEDRSNNDTSAGFASTTEDFLLSAEGTRAY